jgi:hypothetical protein
VIPWSFSPPFPILQKRLEFESVTEVVFELSSAVEREMPESLTLVPPSDTVHEKSIYCALLCGEFGTARPHQEASNSQDDEPLSVVLRISRTAV